MKRSASVVATVVLLAGFLGGCFTGGDETKPAALKAGSLAAGGPASEVEGFDAVTLGLVKTAETFCIALDPYDENKITAAASTYAQHKVTPKVKGDVMTWTMLGPQGRVIVLERDPRPKKYRCRMLFSYAHAPTAVYWLDEFTERFAKAASTQVVKLPQKVVQHGATLDIRLMIVKKVPLIFTVMAAKTGALSIVIVNMEPKKTET